MNKKQLICFWIGIIIIVVMGIFPPWITISSLRRGPLTTKVRNYCGYYPIWKGAADFDASIDFHRLGLQLVIVSVITGGLIYTFKDKKPKDEQNQ